MNQIMMIGGPVDGKIRNVPEEILRLGIYRVPVLVGRGAFHDPEPAQEMPIHTYRMFSIRVPPATPEIPCLFVHEDTPDEQVFPKLFAAYARET